MRPSGEGWTDDEITGLLRAWSNGVTSAFNQVMPLVYDELHRLAARYRRTTAELATPHRVAAVTKDVSALVVNEDVDGAALASQVFLPSSRLVPRFSCRLPRALGPSE